MYSWGQSELTEVGGRGCIVGCGESKLAEFGMLSGHCMLPHHLNLAS